MDSATQNFAKADRVTPKAMRRIILTQSKRANVGHIGSCLCVVEIVCAIYGHLLRARTPRDPQRDRFVLSKGHAALALYAALALRGWISQSELDTFYGDSSSFGVHPERGATGVDFATGSLGHGLSMAAGAALAARLQHSERRVFCLLSDAECNEGAVWEAATFAAHHRLGNLAVVIDLNGQQAMGLTRDVLNMENLEQRWGAFGWCTAVADGHSIPELVAALTERTDARAPLVVLAHTRFGKGVSYMERGVSPARPDLRGQPVNWHYLPMTDEEFRQAVAEIEASA